MRRLWVNRANLMSSKDDYSTRGFALGMCLTPSWALARRGDDRFYHGVSKMRPARMSWSNLSSDVAVALDLQKPATVGSGACGAWAPDQSHRGRGVAESAEVQS